MSEQPAGVSFLPGSAGRQGALIAVPLFILNLCLGHIFLFYVQR